MKAVAVIPWFDSGCFYRAANLDEVAGWYRANFYGPVLVSTGENRGQCRNNGYRVAPADTDVFVFGDADILPDMDALRDGIRSAYETGLLHIGFDKLYKYTQSGFVGNYETGHKGGVLIISRESFERVNGFPELDGWGFEDLIFHIKCRSLFGPPKRLGAAAYHLWHPTPEVNWDPNIPNRVLCQEYDAAVKDPVKMAELIERDRIDL